MFILSLIFFAALVKYYLLDPFLALKNTVDVTLEDVSDEVESNYSIDSTEWTEIVACTVAIARELGVVGGIPEGADMSVHVRDVATQSQTCYARWRAQPRHVPVRGFHGICSVGCVYTFQGDAGGGGE